MHWSTKLAFLAGCQALGNAPWALRVPVLSTEAPQFCLCMAVPGRNHSLWRQEASERLITPCQLPLGEQTFGGEKSSLGRKEGAHQGQGMLTPHSSARVQGCCVSNLPLPGACCKTGSGTLLTALVQVSPVYFLGLSAPSPSTQLSHQ